MKLCFSPFWLLRLYEKLDPPSFSVIAFFFFRKTHSSTVKVHEIQVFIKTKCFIAINLNVRDVCAGKVFQVVQTNP